MSRIQVHIQQSEDHIISQVSLIKFTFLIYLFIYLCCPLLFQIDRVLLLLVAEPVSLVPRVRVLLFGVLHRFQHCTGHITTGSWEGRGNQYIQLVKVLYCKLPTNGKQLPALPLEVGPGTEPPISEVGKVTFQP